MKPFTKIDNSINNAIFSVTKPIDKAVGSFLGNNRLGIPSRNIASIDRRINTRLSGVLTSLPGITTVLTKLKMISPDRSMMVRATYWDPVSKTSKYRNIWVRGRNVDKFLKNPKRWLEKFKYNESSDPTKNHDLEDWEILEG